MNPQTTSLRAVIIIHFVLVIWASMDGYLPYAYMGSNLFIIMLGVLSLLFLDSSEIIFLYLVLHLVSIVQDIVFISLYQPRGYDLYEKVFRGSWTHEFRFCTGMSIINLILKPLTAVMIFRIFKERGGDYGNLNIPGFPQFGQPQGGNYENIDHSAPPNQTVPPSAPSRAEEKTEPYP